MSPPSELVAFMREMNCWEIEFFEQRKINLAQGVDDSQLKEIYAKKLEEILDKYAVKDKYNYGRLVDLGCAKPATYDPATDKLEVLGVGGETMAIKVQQTKGAETCAKIYLVAKDGVWKIKKKEVLSFDDRWRRSPL
ncbi:MULTISPECIES: NTF2 fold immunity protein [Pseudomonas]|nr:MULTISPECIES: NTF2 fold immunity protein [Pseudomonas]